ncbi:Vacuolar protein sorting-associated protein 53 [Coemansia sp. RSA 552]|nr:Vacuolar protein sorting-associated protein 53 [Coemansia sp. RSA 552]
MAPASGAGPSLDSAGFSLEEYVDRVLPDPAALEAADVAAGNIRQRHQAVQDEIRQQLRAQADGRRAQAQNIEATRAAIGELYARISAMKAQARTSERMVQDITQDIRKLDAAKRNLTQTTATMRRLQLLAGAEAQLRVLTEQRRFGDAARVVAAVGGLREAFGEFHSVRAVAALDARAAALQRSLASQAVEAVQNGFDAQGRLVGTASDMRDACLCCDEAATERVVDMYCDLQLRAYAAIFQLDDDASQLDAVARRFAWLRRVLRTYADAHHAAFPEHWRVGEQLARRFATATRDQLGELLATRGTVPIEGLTSALTDTLAFEAQCDKRFGIESSRKIYSDTGKPAESFQGAISCAFEPYLALFVGAEQRRLEGLVRRFQQDPISADSDSDGVLASSTDLLLQFRESLRQCVGLSTAQPMADLARVLNQGMAAYARSVLVHRLPRITAKSTAPLDDLRRACLIINTADYCASAAAQLEQKIAERIDPEFRTKLTFAPCREALLAAINAAIGTLASGAEAMCEPALSALAAEPWHDVQTVGDQSRYVVLAASALEAATQAVRTHLSATTRYFRSFCDKLAARFSDRYYATISACPRISEVGAEQLLLDAQALKSVLVRLPVLAVADDDDDGDDGEDAGKGGAGKGAAERRPPPAYARIVAKGVGRIEALLKAILVPCDPADALVGRFLLLFPAAPRDVFRLVLRLKGVAPSEHPTYIRILQQTHSAASDHQQEATPERQASVPAHVSNAMSASAPLESRKSATRDAGRSKIALPGRPTSSYAQTLAARGLHPDPLGITGATMQSADLHGTPSPIAGDDSEQASSTDGAESPGLASWAANATATRTRLNENLRRFMSNMRRA